MTFFDANMSFFLDSVSAVSQPTVQVVPLNDSEVFQYLDAHPDALRRYLEERVVLLRSLNSSIGSEPVGDQAVSEEESILASPLEEVADNESSEDESFTLLDITSHIATNEEAREADVEDEVFIEKDTSDEEEIEAGPQAQPHQSRRDSPAVANRHITTTAAAAATTKPTPTPEPSDFVPYPAPDHLLEASKKEPVGKKWRLFEEDACIKHMIDIRDEGALKGEARFTEAQARMKVVDGITKDGKTAVKNFWNRVGRARSGFDERKNKRAPLSTSQQGSISSAWSSSPPSSRASTHLPQSKMGAPRASRAQTSCECDDTEDGEEDQDSDYSEWNAVAERQGRKRSMDDSEEDWKPRGTKKARTG